MFTCILYNSKTLDWFNFTAVASAVTRRVTRQTTIWLRAILLQACRSSLAGDQEDQEGTLSRLDPLDKLECEIVTWFLAKLKFDIIDIFVRVRSSSIRLCCSSMCILHLDIDLVLVFRRLFLGYFWSEQCFFFGLGVWSEKWSMSPKLK